MATVPMSHADAHRIGAICLECTPPGPYALQTCGRCGVEVYTQRTDRPRCGRCRWEEADQAKHPSRPST